MTPEQIEVMREKLRETIKAINETLELSMQYPNVISDAYHADTETLTLLFDGDVYTTVQIGGELTEPY